MTGYYPSVLVLALDTSTRAGSCAVSRDGDVIREDAADPLRSHDAQLPGSLMTLLERTALTLADIDVYAVATGPGSFTGLRVGIAAMQGLAFARTKPLVGISAFDALARKCEAPARKSGGGLVATWIDAWRGEVYAALYRHGREVEAPSVEHPEVILGRLSRQGPCTFIGEGAETYKDMIFDAMGNGGRFATPVSPPLAGMVASLATESARAGELPPPHAIRPLYVRRPDAVLARDARPVR
jgi:tRNA threonylcarbamoyladenosine biosynthesis protein TsaB